MAFARVSILVFTGQIKKYRNFNGDVGAFASKVSILVFTGQIKKFKRDTAIIGE